MKNDQPIPQHALRGSDGRPLSFEVQEWGEHQGYDHQHPHRHHFHEILVFERGGGKHDIDFTTYDAATHSLHFVGSDNVHVLLRDSSSAGYSLLFAPDYLDDTFITSLPFSSVQPVLLLDETEFAYVTQLTDQIRSELSSDQPYAENIIRSHMQTLMLYLMRICAVRQTTDDKSSLPEHVRSFQEMVARHHADNYTIETYAAELHISAKHLIDICKKHTGKTPLQYIREHRVMEAKRLLFHTKLPVKEIAYKLRFDEPGNFSKYFKSVTGYTPEAYRKGIR